MADLSATSVREPRVSKTVLLAGAGLAAITVIGIMLVFAFVSDQRERDMRAWQTRMSIVADSRFAAVNGWIEAQYGEMRSLAENASLQLYLTELALFEGDASQVTDEPAQRTYLRNLLVSSAERSGFTAPVLGAEINANVERIGVAGMAIVDNDGAILVATPGMPPIDADLAAIILANRGQRALYDMHIDAGGQATVGFLAPIFALQSDGAPSDQIGMAVGVKEVGSELYPLLKQPGAGETSAEAMLLRDNGTSIDYLSPLMDGGAPLSRSMAHDTPERQRHCEPCKPSVRVKALRLFARRGHQTTRLWKEFCSNRPRICKASYPLQSSFGEGKEIGQGQDSVEGKRKIRPIGFARGV